MAQLGQNSGLDTVRMGILAPFFPKVFGACRRYLNYAHEIRRVTKKETLCLTLRCFILLAAFGYII